MNFCSSSLFLTFLGCFIHMNAVMASSLYKLEGVVCEKETKEPLPFVQVYIENRQLGTLTDVNGAFLINNLSIGEIQLEFRCIGYRTQEMNVELQGDTILYCEMEMETLRLSEVEVMSDRRMEGDRLRVRQSALEYIQPLSLHDVFQLLPGYLSQDGGLDAVEQYSARQAGEDENTAMGLALVSDGVSVSNNAQSQMLNVVGYQKDDLHSTVNRGVDLRRISVNHLEQVEVEQGIASAKYGDMSSGVVRLSSKRGIMPMEARVRINSQMKSIYAGRGLRLSDKSTLHVGMDATKAQSDVSSDLTSFTRVSAQFNYMRKSQLDGRELIHNWKLNYTGALDRDKDDALLKSSVDTYKTDYQNISLTINECWMPAYSWLDEMKLVMSCSYTSDVLKRTLTVNAGGSYATTLSKEMGGSEGFYLPAEYVSDYRTDSKPLDASVLFALQSTFGSHRIEGGVDVRYSKNRGNGLSMDETRPPFPTLEIQYKRQSLKNIPAWVQSAFYAEDHITLQKASHSLDMNIGFRVSGMQNLPSDYSLHGKYHIEPRLNIKYAIPTIYIQEKKLDIHIRGGYGEHVKYPTLDMLYPQAANNHKISANYFTEDAESRFVWISSNTINRENKALQANRNIKKEIGLDLRYENALLNVTLFEEKSQKGFAAKNNYESWYYHTYKAKSSMPEGKPSISDFDERQDSAFVLCNIAQNGSSVQKKGIEYRLVLPEIKGLATKIEINGAYYKTSYKTSMVEQRRGSEIVLGKNYPYVGLYDWNNNDRTCTRFNTNFWINTQLTRYRLIFTAMFQCLWLNTEQYQYHEGTPSSYMTMDGETHEFTQKALADNPLLADLVFDYVKNYFDKESYPVSISLNLKATKEIGENVKMSFLVNRLWDYNPLRKDRVGYNIRTWTKPYFSMELMVKL